MSLLDIDERILKLADLVEFDRSPINDYKKFCGRCTVGIIEGGCCNEENVHVLEDFRKHCDMLIALGDCAISGGVPAMRNNLPVGETLEHAYRKAPGVWNPGGTIPADPELPLLLNRVYSCHEVVKIDTFIPGCPPPADTIWDTVFALVTGQPVTLAYERLKYD
jgi:NAD-reducing hydrogenase small subunit